MLLDAATDHWDILDNGSCFLNVALSFVTPLLCVHGVPLAGSPRYATQTVVRLTLLLLRFLSRFGQPLIRHGSGFEFSGYALVHSDLGLSDGSPAHAGEPTLSGALGSPY